MLLFIRAQPTPRLSGPAHTRPRPAPHYLSRRQPGPACQPRRRATAETPPPSAVPHRPLKREPPAADHFFLPRVPFVSSVHARAPHTLPPPPRRPPCRLPATGAPPPCRTPSERHRRPPPSGERPLLRSSIDRRLLTPGLPRAA
jgi:hypothetical protein